MTRAAVGIGLCLALIAGLAVFATAEDDPCPDPPSELDRCLFFNSSDPKIARYEEMLHDLFDLSSRPNHRVLLARMLTTPSFEPESVVSLYQDPSGAVYLEALAAPENVWYHGTPERSALIRHACAIPPDVAEWIAAVWLQALANVTDHESSVARKCEDGSSVICLDGTSYAFQRDGAPSCAETTNCDVTRGSERERMVRLGEELARYCTLSAEEGRSASAETIRDLLDALSSGR